MAFHVIRQQTNDETPKESNVDWSSYHQHIVSTVDAELEQTIPGVIVGVIDLGLQEQEDAAMPFGGTPEEEAEAIKQYPGTYFEDMPDPKTKKIGRYKRWKQKPTQCVTLAIDFPDIMIDHSLYLTGESDPKPYRAYLGGSFFLGRDVGMVVAKPLNLRQKKNEDGVWAFAPTHTLHKIASGAKLLENGVFKAENIDQLIGKTLSWKVQVFLKEVKDKKYLTEKISYASGLARGMSELEMPCEPFVIQFDEDNNLTLVGELRRHIVNTIKRATNYEGSKIQAQLESLKETSQKDAPAEAPAKETPAKEAPKPAKSKAAQKAVPTPATDEDPQDCPF